MESLTDKEVTVLELMAQGEDMLAIGNWKPIIESLLGHFDSCKRFEIGRVWCVVWVKVICVISTELV